MGRNVLIVVAVLLVMVVATFGKEDKGLKVKGKRAKALNKYLKDKKHQEVRALCQSTEFECHPEGCISIDEVCDTHRNCPGGDDELACPKDCSGPHQFKCEDNSKCLGLVDKCDGYHDCNDFSDEAFCGAFECPAGRFKCVTSGECIKNFYICDHDKDCRDGSDENNCHNGTCSSAQWKCTNGNCIPKDFLCDADNDCGDRSDEMRCSCTASQFKCNTGLCIPTYHKCDGDNDCGDLSDELNCPEIPSSSCRDVMTFEDCFHMNETTHPVCLTYDDGHKFCRKFCGFCS